MYPLQNLDFLFKTISEGGSPKLISLHFLFFICKKSFTELCPLSEMNKLFYFRFFLFSRFLKAREYPIPFWLYSGYFHAASEGCGSQFHGTHTPFIFVRCISFCFVCLCFDACILVILLDSLSRFAPTAIRSMFSKTVAENEQGRVFSLISVVELVCTLLASICFHTLFPYSISFFPQLSFVLMGAILILPICLIA